MAEEQTPLIQVAAFVDKDNDPVTVIIINGVTYARMESSLTEAIATAQSTCAALERYRDAKSLNSVTVDNTERDPSKEN